MARTWTREHAINLQTRRKAQRWTLDQLATRANLTVDVVQQLERADEMDLDDDEVLRQLALALGVLPKQLCNSPLRPSRKPNASNAPIPAPAVATSLDAADPSINRRSGTWAIATVALLLVAAAFLPRACERMSAPEVPQAAIAPQPSLPKATTPAPAATDPAAGATDQADESAKEIRAAAITALIADLTTPALTGASDRMVEALDQPIEHVRAALRQQASDPGSPVTERLVMILILRDDGPILRDSLSGFLQEAIAANDGALPWPAPAVESAIAMGAAEDAPGAALAIETVLDDAQLLAADRSALKAAIERAQDGPRNAPAPQVGDHNLLEDTEAATALLPRPGTDLLQVDSATGDALAPLPADVEADPFARFTASAELPPVDAAEVANVLQQARDAAASGHIMEVRAALAGWLRDVPSEWMTNSGKHPDMWRMLGWALFPGDAPVWEQAFGVDEERWLILVVAKLLDGASN